MGAPKAGGAAAVDATGGPPGGPGAATVADTGAIVVAAGVRVLAVLTHPDAATVTDGALIVVAASEQVARRLVSASALGRLGVTLRPP